MTLLGHVIPFVCSSAVESIPVCLLFTDNLYSFNNAVYQSSKLCTQSQVSWPVPYSSTWHFLIIILSCQMSMVPKGGHFMFSKNEYCLRVQDIAVCFFYFRVVVQHVALVVYPSSLLKINNISSGPRGGQFCCLYF